MGGQEEPWLLPTVLWPQVMGSAERAVGTACVRSCLWSGSAVQAWGSPGMACWSECVLFLGAVFLFQRNTQTCLQTIDLCEIEALRFPLKYMPILAWLPDAFRGSCQLFPHPSSAAGEYRRLLDVFSPP